MIKETSRSSRVRGVLHQKFMFKFNDRVILKPGLLNLSQYEGVIGIYKSVLYDYCNVQYPNPDKNSKLEFIEVKIRTDHLTLA